MDPLTLGVSVAAISQLAVKIGEYLRDAKDASSKRSLNLISHVDESSHEPWQTKVLELGGNEGLICQYRVALEQLKDKIPNTRGRHTTKTVLHTLSKEIESRKVSMHKESKVIKSGVNAIQQDQDRERHRLIMDWISLADFPAQQSDFIGHRQKQTGMWFLESQEFTEWVHGSNRTLFCPGIPGAGKTMMSAITVGYLQDTLQSSTIGLQGQADVRFMATSRHISEIVDEFKGMPRLEVRASHADVKRYVLGQIDKFLKYVQRNSDLQAYVQTKIAEAVDGM
ncbi:hypothetical protein P280DRAFT_523005 [Massarina eburnea CBS 473.64]|uniref:Nephrocystin 3-like N-terminal domain-containing protein n=1 Tax=Massarina eburnea CBS 473.64 TaxID=1395130 RepID=A0A6A6RN22_9PLEO|nr:hypothetical protein P280DRAFT_523005 [Massarina eburnea CBS 473.64]